MVRSGTDPLSERREGRGSSRDGSEAQTFDQQALKYLQHHAMPHRSSWREDARRLGYVWDGAAGSFHRDVRKRDDGESSGQIVRKSIGRRRLSEVQVGDVLRIKEAIGSRGRVEANRVCELIRSVFNMAIQWRDLPPDHDNPATRVKRFEETSRERWVKPDELPRLAAAIQAQSNLYIRAALWLYLLTGLRRRELLRAEWNHIDLESRRMFIPETKNNRPRELKLAPEAIAILEALPREVGNPHIFPGRKEGSHLVNIDKAWRKVRREAGLEDLHLHDLRRTVGSLLASKGISLRMIADVLGHSDQRATEVYARIHEDVTQATIDEHADNLLAIAGVSIQDVVTPLREDYDSARNETQAKRPAETGRSNGH
jgi:integrase